MILSTDSRKRKQQSTLALTFQCGLRSANWRWNPRYGKFVATQTVYSKLQRTEPSQPFQSARVLQAWHFLISRKTTSLSILVHKCENERLKKSGGGEPWFHDKSPLVTSSDYSRVLMAQVKKVARWKTQRASKLAPRCHVFPQRREVHGGKAQIWRDILVVERAENHTRAKLQVKWRRATWFQDCPSKGGGVDSRTLSQQHCAVVDH